MLSGVLVLVAAAVGGKHGGVGVEAFDGVIGDQSRARYVDR